jgi:uncharacterized membrane protein HdeD (DUF308 family)
LKQTNLRQRYYIVVSVLYVALGVVIAFRSAAAHVLPIAILGLIFIALGVVRLRDFYSPRGQRR